MPIKLIANSHLRRNSTQLNSPVMTVGDNAMTSSALWRHAAVYYVAVTFATTVQALFGC